MKHSIFIRSYSKDMEWLKYCLRSLKKNWDMKDGEVVVCFPNSEYDRLKGEIILDFPWVKLSHWSDSHKHGYIDQQINKLHADIFCEGEYIVFVDSDCFLTKPNSFEKFFKNNKPIWLHTDYNKVGDAICWRECTERATNKSVDREYMRRIPMIVVREDLKLVRDYVSSIQGEFIPYMSRLDRISEFNLMGAVLHELKPNGYNWTNTDDEVPPTDWVQNWSHSGITEDEKKHLEGLLK